MRSRRYVSLRIGRQGQIRKVVRLSGAVTPKRNTRRALVNAPAWGILLQRDTYTITLSGDGWALQLNGQHLAQFDNESAAAKAATVGARMSQHRGRIADIHLVASREP